LPTQVLISSTMSKTRFMALPEPLPSLILEE
jgi:hypothetical protein